MQNAEEAKKIEIDGSICATLRLHADLIKSVIAIYIYIYEWPLRTNPVALVYVILNSNITKSQNENKAKKKRRIAEMMEKTPPFGLHNGTDFRHY